MNISKQDELNINDKMFSEHLKKFSELDLHKHYDFEVKCSTSLDKLDLISKYIEANTPLTFKFDESNMLYYSITDEIEDALFEIDVSKSFSKSDIWLFDKLISVSSVFPNACSSLVSEEMSSYYICLIVSSVFRSEFYDEFIETCNEYDFASWEGSKNFMSLYTSWVQLGSKYVKMVMSAARYALLREKQKKQIPSALQLPEEVVLKLNKLIRDVDIIRYQYDEVELSASKREIMSRLEVKMIIQVRDKAIHDTLTSDTKMYQIWRLMNLNSTHIPPNILLKINRISQSSALEIWQGINGIERLPLTVDEKISVKAIENKLKKETKRAYLNKLFASEALKFVSSPEKYIAPSFT